MTGVRGRAEVCVVGGGVVGLTTAVHLAEDGRSVRVVTADEPGRTTSAAAGALVGLAFIEPLDRVRRWDQETSEVMVGLADDPTTGVHLTRCLFASRQPVAVPPPLAALRDVAPASTGELPAGFTGGFWLTLPAVDMPRYLTYLIGRLAAAGGEVQLRRVGDLEEVVGEARAVVNCSGVGARSLAHDPSVVPSRGQHVILSNPGVDTMFMEGPPGQQEWAAWMPHGQRLVVGGVAQPGRSDLEPDPEVAERLVERVRLLNPLLHEAEVLGHQVGLRPERPAVRVELVHLQGTPIVHNYGHGGVGVTLSWGCAHEVAALLDSRFQRSIDERRPADENGV